MSYKREIGNLLGLKLKIQIIGINKTKIKNIINFIL
jgi:hypothetical protein